MPISMQMEAFHKKEIDIGFIRTPVMDPNISLLSVHQETCVVLVPKLHSLASCVSVSMGDLSKERVILVEREVWPSWYDDILSKCRDAGFSPVIRQHVKEIQTVVGLVAARLGISIVPRSTVNLHARDVAYVTIEGEAPSVEMSIAWRTNDHSNTVRRFIEAVTRIIG
jgi:DNA-binding transcriptional LysR family regulator